MSKLNVEQRKQLPESDFGDPANRLFPIMDQSDVHDAAPLVGKARDPKAVKSRIIAIANRKGFSLPDAWKETKHEVGMTACFSLEAIFASQTQDMVLRKAPLIFRAGDYPDKAFSMTPEDMLTAHAEFSPVEIDLEHKPTVLNGKLGRVIEVNLSGDASEMGGLVEIPKWLDAILDANERKLSATFDRNTKRLIGCSIVRNPRISDARLLAEFARYDAESSKQTDHGQAKLKALHDMSASHGAICGNDDNDGDNDADQNDDDMNAGYNGMYNAMVNSGMKAGFSAEDAAKLSRKAIIDFKRSRRAIFTSGDEMGKIQRIHDISSEAGKHCAVYSATSNQGGPTYPDQRSDAGINDLNRLNASGGREMDSTKQTPVSNPSGQGGPTYPRQRDDGGINDNRTLNADGQNTAGVAQTPQPLQQYMAPQATTGTTPDTSSVVQGKDGQGAPALYEDHNKPGQFSANPVQSAPTAPTVLPNGTPMPSLQSPGLAQLAAMTQPPSAIPGTPIATAAFNNPQDVALQTALQQERAARIDAEAVLFATTEIGQGRAMPAQRDGLIDSYRQAASDDAKLNEPVMFEGRSVSRVDALKRKHLQVQTHNLNKEILPSQDSTVAAFAAHTPGQTPDNAKMGEPRRKQLLSLTTLGRMTASAAK